MRYRVFLKRRGDTTAYTVAWHPEAGVLGWVRTVEDDAPGARLTTDAARELARDAVVGLGLDLDDLEERAAATTELPDRTDHVFMFERSVSTTPELRERTRVHVTGERVTAAGRILVVPPAAARAARAAEAPGRALQTLGILMATIGVLAGFFTFLRQLERGNVRLGLAATWPTVVFACLVFTYALERSNLFRNWEPLWPKWVSDFQYLAMRGFEGLLLVLLLLVVVAAGDALDRRGPAPRGQSLWTLARGRIDAGVARASFNGFVVGLLCGGTLAGSVLLLQSVLGAETAIQPRGFFLYTLNSSVPVLTSVLFFLGVALTEELGYRFFGGSALMALTGRRWLAVALPALIYGLTHTRFEFLPPASPWWARALVLTLVGAVWGWAFLRYDALTVVLSHFTADLFIFNWPLVAGDGPTTTALAVASIGVPLLPGLIWLATGRRRS